MPKYRIIHPTNGFEAGAVVELSEKEAEDCNANEPLPRVELVKEEAPAEEEPQEKETKKGKK